MGLFDDLTCAYPLPDIGVVNWRFQTKTFDCALAHYHITADGRLLVAELDETQATPVHVYGEPYHGCLEFHDFRDDIWYSFRAKFTDGQLVDIKIVEIRDTNYESDSELP